MGLGSRASAFWRPTSASGSRCRPWLRRPSPTGSSISRLRPSCQLPGRIPLGTLVNNIAGQVNLIESVIARGEKPSILLICSNEEYGMVEPAGHPHQGDNALPARQPVRGEQGSPGHARLPVLGLSPACQSCGSGLSTISGLASRPVRRLELRPPDGRGGDWAPGHR